MSSPEWLALSPLDRRLSVTQATQQLRRLVVGGKKSLQRQLRQRDVHRRAEYRGRADEGQHAMPGVELQRYRHAARIDRRAVRLRRIEMQRLQLVQQRDQLG